MHPASIQPPKQVDVASNVHPNQYNKMDDYLHQIPKNIPSNIDNSKRTGRVLPWSDDSVIQEDGLNLGDISQGNIMLITDPTTYIPASKRGENLAETSKIFYEGPKELTGSILLDDHYDYDNDRNENKYVSKSALKYNDNNISMVQSLFNKRRKYYQEK